jgi:hypothetical protein
MQTSDGVWCVDVGGVGAIRWYRLFGHDAARNLPSLAALIEATNAGVDMANLREVETRV